jgi:hypothetical protein
MAKTGEFIENFCKDFIKARLKSLREKAYD